MVEMSNIEKLFANTWLSLLLHKMVGLSKALDWVEPSMAKKILEIGCGVGITTKLIALRFNKAKIIALDYDKAQIDIAKKKQNVKNIRFIRGDAKSLKFKDNSFDVVFASLTFHHIPRYEESIREAYRVLKRGGKIIVVEHATKSVNLFHNLIHVQPAEFTKEEFLGKLKKAKFVVKRTEGNHIFTVEAIK